MKNKINPSEEIGVYYVKVREKFDQIRHQKKEGFSLKWRLFIVVATGMAVGIWLGYGIYELLRVLGVEFDSVNLLLEVSIVSLLCGLGFSLLLSKWVFKPLSDP